MKYSVVQCGVELSVHRQPPVMFTRASGWCGGGGGGTVGMEGVEERWRGIVEGRS